MASFDARSRALCCPSTIRHLPPSTPHRILDRKGPLLRCFHRIATLHHWQATIVADPTFISSLFTVRRRSHPHNRSPSFGDSHPSPSSPARETPFTTACQAATSVPSPWCSFVAAPPSPSPVTTGFVSSMVVHGLAPATPTPPTTPTSDPIGLNPILSTPSRHRSKLHGSVPSPRPRGPPPPSTDSSVHDCDRSGTVQTRAATFPCAEPLHPQ